MKRKLFSLPDLAAAMPEVTLWDGKDYQIRPLDAIGFQHLRALRETLAPLEAEQGDQVIPDHVVVQMQELAGLALPDAPAEELQRLPPVYLMDVIAVASKRIEQVMEIAKNGQGTADSTAASPSAPPIPTPPSSSRLPAH